MKKVLSIVLAVIMAFSALGVGSFAMTVEDLPIFPEQTEGRIYFAADTTWIEVGAGTYEVPVYLISDYSVDYEVGFCELGFNVSLTGDNQYATILDVKASDELMAMDGYVDIETGFGEGLYSIDPDIGYCAFKVDGSAILKQDMLTVAYVTVEVNEEFPGGEAAPCLFFSGYEFDWTEEYSFCGFGGIFSIDQEVAAFEEPATYLELAVGNDGDIFFSNGYMMEKPAKVYTWKADLVNWFEGIVDQIFAIGDEIHDFINTIIGVIRMALGIEAPPAEPAE